MLDVQLDPVALEAALGARIVELDLDLGAPPAALPAGVELGDVEPEALRRSLLVAGAFEVACRRAGAIAGAVHCHGEAFAGNAEIGIVCCAAVNHMTAAGVPFACTGDDCTAVALFLAQSFAGAAQYLELDAADEELGACLVTSGGEGDARLARTDQPVRVCENRFFSGVAGRGAALEFVLRPGPATLLGFTPCPSGFRVVAAEVEVLDVAPPPLAIPRGYVRFDRLRAGEAFDRWCEAGVNHHLALAPGRCAYAAVAFAEITGLEAVVL